MISNLMGQRWLGIALLVFAGVYAGFVYDAHRIPPAARRLRAADIPISVDELKERYSPEPVEDNGAFLYMEAAEKLRDPDKATHEHLPIEGDLEFSYGHHFTPEQREALSTYVGLNAEPLALIQEAQKKPFVHLPLDRYDPLISPYLQEILPLATLVRCAILDASLAGDAQKLKTMVIKGLRLHEMMAPRGVLTDELVAQAICMMMFETLEYSLAYLQSSIVGVHIWQQYLAQERYTGLAAIRQALRYETTLYYSIFCFEGFLLEVPREPVAQVMPFRWAMEWTQFFYLPQNAFINEMKALIKVEAESIYAILAKISRESSKHRYGFRHFMYYPGSFAFTYQTTARLIAGAAAARSALAALQYQHDHGRLPDTLEDLVPGYLDAVPRDPFTPDGTIRYRIREDHAVFYSLGPNEEDNGGTVFHDDGDIIFRLPLPGPVGRPQGDHEVVSGMRTLTKDRGDLAPPQVLVETGGYL